MIRSRQWVPPSSHEYGAASFCMAALFLDILCDSGHLLAQHADDIVHRDDPDQLPGIVDDRHPPDTLGGHLLDGLIDPMLSRNVITSRVTISPARTSPGFLSCAMTRT